MQITKNGREGKERGKLENGRKIGEKGK